MLFYSICEIGLKLRLIVQVRLNNELIHLWNADFNSLINDRLTCAITVICDIIDVLCATSHHPFPLLADLPNS